MQVILYKLTLLRGASERSVKQLTGTQWDTECCKLFCFLKNRGGKDCLSCPSEMIRAWLTSLKFYVLAAGQHFWKSSHLLSRNLNILES